jgi:hypothetical protein
VLGLAVAAVAAVGIAVGMLAAPRVSRWLERDDEEADDGPG